MSDLPEIVMLYLEGVELEVVGTMVGFQANWVDLARMHYLTTGMGPEGAWRLHGLVDAGPPLLICGSWQEFDAANRALRLLVRLRAHARLAH